MIKALYTNQVLFRWKICKKLAWNLKNSSEQLLEKHIHAEFWWAYKKICFSYFQNLNDLILKSSIKTPSTNFELINFGIDDCEKIFNILRKNWRELFEKICKKSEISWIPMQKNISTSNSIKVFKSKFQKLTFKKAPNYFNIALCQSISLTSSCRFIMYFLNVRSTT